MSKAFTRESDDGVDDVIPTEEPTLPPGAKNYVTPDGARRLREEIERLRSAPRGDAKQKLAAERRLRALLARLEIAEIVTPPAEPPDRVLFGATVTLQGEVGTPVRRYQIVGVDEADARRGLVSWLSPIARALIDAKVGDVVTVKTPAGEDEVEVVRIEYGVAPRLG